VVQRGLGTLRQHVEQEAARRLEGLFKKGLRKFLLRELVATSAIGGFDLAKQELDVHVFHIRRDVNWGEFAEAAGLGALAGAVTSFMTTTDGMPDDGAGSDDTPDGSADDDYRSRSRDQQKRPKFKSADALKASNKLVRWAADKAGLNDDGEAELHDLVHGSNMSKQEILQAAQEIYQDNPKYRKR
jgi:hypothetical protein